MHLCCFPFLSYSHDTWFSVGEPSLPGGKLLDYMYFYNQEPIGGLIQMLYYLRNTSNLNTTDFKWDTLLGGAATNLIQNKGGKSGRYPLLLV